MNMLGLVQPKENKMSCVLCYKELTEESTGSIFRTTDGDFAACKDCGARENVPERQGEARQHGYSDAVRLSYVSIASLPIQLALEAARRRN